MEVYNLTNEEMEDGYDKVKTVILEALVSDNLLDGDEAEKWCLEHTIILKKKPFFRTISDKFSKFKGDNDVRVYMLVVKGKEKV